MNPDEIRASIAHLGMTQRQFAKALGVSVQTVTKWLSGKHATPPFLSLAVLLLLRRHEKARRSKIISGELMI